MSDLQFYFDECIHDMEAIILEKSIPSIARLAKFVRHVLRTVHFHALGETQDGVFTSEERMERSEMRQQFITRIRHLFMTRVLEIDEALCMAILFRGPNSPSPVHKSNPYGSLFFHKRHQTTLYNPLIEEVDDVQSLVDAMGTWEEYDVIEV